MGAVKFLAVAVGSVVIGDRGGEFIATKLKLTGGSETVTKLVVGMVSYAVLASVTS